MTDVKTELSSFISVDGNKTENEESVSNILRAFEGKQTPFVKSQMAKEISEEISLEQKIVAKAIDDMQRFGIFEQVPKKPQSYRAGQMYKTALRMKYVRKRSV